MLGAAGAVVGRFVARVADRLPRGERIIGARSGCDACGRRLAPRDRVPPLGDVIERGRCRTFGGAIGWQTPAIVGAAAAVGLAAAIAGTGLPAVAAAVLGWSLLALAVIDARHFWLPPILTLPLIAVGLGVSALLDPDAVVAHAVGAAAGFAVLWLVARAYRAARGRDGLGGGDAKLFAASGAWLGWHELSVVLVAASLLGLAAALVIWRGRVTATTRLPFGVFIGAATWGVYLLRLAR